jgi:hypothetical protein
MSNRNDLAAIVNSVNEAGLAGLSFDDLFVLLEGLGSQARGATVSAARKRLATIILRNIGLAHLPVTGSRRLH